MDLTSPIGMSRIRLIATALVLIRLSTGTAGAEDFIAESFNPATVKMIDFRLTESSGSNIVSAPGQRSIDEQVIRNLSGWRFPLKKAGETLYSHVLTADIGPVSHQSTPVGFSFSAGNSDPRAPEFQKANVMTVRCTLMEMETAQTVASQSLEFAATPIVESLTRKRDEATALARLADHISTVCFNLLDGLHLQQPGPAGTEAVKQPAWMPEIRIESVDEPVIKSVESIPIETGQAVETIKQDENASESRKQVIIHNQGSPVILKMGHDRM